MSSGGTAMTTAVTSAITSMVGVISSNILPLATSEPFVYFLAIALISGAAGIFARLRHTVR